MKIVRIVCVLGALVGALSSGASTASAGSISCYYYCSGWQRVATCYTDLASCCDLIQIACPAPSEFQGGQCSDGVSYCYA